MAIDWSKGEGPDEPTEPDDAPNQASRRDAGSHRYEGKIVDAESGDSGRGWRTITEEIGERKSWSSFRAAKRELGPRPGTDLHHIVEQSQAKPERSGFDVELINSSDNLARVPKDVHTRVTSEYSSKPPGLPLRLRDLLDGVSWDEQYQRGCEVLDEKIEEIRDHDRGRPGRRPDPAAEG